MGNHVNFTRHPRVGLFLTSLPVRSPESQQPRKGGQVLSLAENLAPVCRNCVRSIDSPVSHLPVPGPRVSEPPSGQSCPCPAGGQLPLHMGVPWPLPATLRGIPVPAPATPWRYNSELASEPGSTPETREGREAPRPGWRRRAGNVVSRAAWGKHSLPVPMVGGVWRPPQSPG